MKVLGYEYENARDFIGDDMAQHRVFCQLVDEAADAPRRTEPPEAHWALQRLRIGLGILLADLDEAAKDHLREDADMILRMAKTKRMMATGCRYGESIRH